MERQTLTLVVIGAAILAFLLSRNTISSETLLLFALLAPSIILHEVSHGWAALVFGDDTAKREGRLTLNPIAHVDPFGTIILPAMLILTTGSGFGYAKPVPVNPGRMRSPRNHSLIVSLAGPATNIVIALVCVLVFRITRPYSEFGNLTGLGEVLFDLGSLNVILAAFNLIPIPPLDGSAVIERLLPKRYWPSYARFRQYSMGLLLVLVLLVPGALSRVFDPALRVWRDLLV